MKKYILLLLLCLFTVSLYSMTIDELSNSDEWRNLLLDDPYGKGFITDNSKMFACGEKDYKKEIEYLLENINNELLIKYPARYECISRNLNLDIDYLSINPELIKYLKENDYDQLSIALSEPINDQLMSMFGHAIVLLSHKDENIGEGVSINLFAHLDNLSSTEVIINGLNGHLVGYFAFDRAALIFENYSLKLNRELVVFKTNINKEQIQRILLMVWELNNAPISYQFINRNCVNGALSLLDYSLGNVKLRERANSILLPYSLVKVLKEKNYIIDWETYSPASSQFNLEQSRDKAPEYNIRKTYWTDDGWENELVKRELTEYIPIKDKYKRPFYIDNNLSFVDFQTNLKLDNLNNYSFNLEVGFLSADTWQRVFSSPRFVKTVIGQINLFYNDNSNFGLSNFTLWEQQSYYKLKFFSRSLSNGIKIAIDNNFNDNKLKPYISITRGLSIGLCSFMDIPNDPLLIYCMADASTVFDYFHLNIGINSGILLKNKTSMINLDTYYSITNFTKNNIGSKSNRIDLIAKTRLNENIIFGLKYNILQNILSTSLRYSFSPWGF
ncbi:MAG: DUF4105 domain-containing protein [Spirochaetia bacterium]|nr:DUF4105 domain-containing protein [Spirochaetia bacterium]